jgi:hypothetical protein
VSLSPPSFSLFLSLSRSLPCPLGVSLLPIPPLRRTGSTHGRLRACYTREHNTERNLQTHCREFAHPVQALHSTKVFVFHPLSSQPFDAEQKVVGGAGTTKRAIFIRSTMKRSGTHRSLKSLFFCQSSVQSSDTKTYSASRSSSPTVRSPAVRASSRLTPLSCTNTRTHTSPVNKGLYRVQLFDDREYVGPEQILPAGDECD